MKRRWLTAEVSWSPTADGAVDDDCASEINGDGHGEGAYVDDDGDKRRSLTAKVSWSPSDDDDDDDCDHSDDGADIHDNTWARRRSTNFPLHARVVLPSRSKNAYREEDASNPHRMELFEVRRGHPDTTSTDSLWRVRHQAQMHPPVRRPLSQRRTKACGTEWLG